MEPNLVSTFDILFTKCTPNTPADYEAGLGGNENTIIHWSRELTRRGHRVTVFTPHEQDREIDGVCWRGLGHWSPSRAIDVLLAVRGVEPLLATADLGARHVALLLGDRVTRCFEAACSSGIVDTVVCVSEAQRALYAAAAGVDASSRVDWLVTSCGYEEDELGEPHPDRTPYRVLHASAPYRGLANVLRIWPRIVAAIPEAELHVVGGYQLWGHSRETARVLAERAVPGVCEPKAQVVQHGALPRSAYVSLVRSAEVMLYPTAYEEMCCIAALEAAAAGVVPVLSRVAALAERVVDGRTGHLLPSAEVDGWEDAFVETTIALLRDRARLRAMSREATAAARSETTGNVIGRLLGYLEAKREVSDAA